MKTRPPPLRGRVVDQASHQPLPGLAVEVLDVTSGERRCLGAARTGKAGRFAVPLEERARRKIPARSILVEVRKRGGALLASSRADLPAGPPREVRFEIAVPDGLVRAHVPELTRVGGQPVNREAAARLSLDDLVEVRRWVEGRPHSLRDRAAVERAFPFLAASVAAKSDCGAGASEFVRKLLAERVPADHPVFQLDKLVGTVRWFFTPDIAVAYTLTNPTSGDGLTTLTAPPPSPFELLLSDDTPISSPTSTLQTSVVPPNTGTQAAPQYVQWVGLSAQAALTRYLGAPFSLRDPRAPLDPLDQPVEPTPRPRVVIQIVALGNNNGQTDPAWDHIEIKKDLRSLDEVFSAVSHELFHRIQYEYNRTNDHNEMEWALREGGARFAQDCVWDGPNLYAASAALPRVPPGNTEFANPSPSLVIVAGDAPRTAYGAGLFWKYVSEQHSTETASTDEPAIGIDAHRLILEQTATPLGYTAGALRAARTGMPFYGSFDGFMYYQAGFPELNTHETTWGNYLLAKVLHRTSAPASDHRFRFMEDGDRIDAGLKDCVTSVSFLHDLVQELESLPLAQGATITRAVTNLGPWSAQHYLIVPSTSSPPRMLRVTFTAGAGSDPLVQIVRLRGGQPSDAATTVDDIHRSDQLTYTKTLSMAGLTAVAVIVSSREHPCTYTLHVDEIASASDVMITRWNTAAGTEYEIDPIGWRWTWVSPDVTVPGGTVYFGRNNTLQVRLRNRGNAPVSGIDVAFWYQRATPFLSSTAWMPVRDASPTPVIQQVTNASLGAAGSSTADQWFSVNWAPVDDGTGQPHWCVKIVVSVPDDLFANTDNKVALSNFTNVIHASSPTGDLSESSTPSPSPPSQPDAATALLIRAPEAPAHHELVAIPRGPTWTLGAEVPERLRRRAGNAAAHRPGPALPAPDAAAVTSLAIRRSTAHEPADRARRTARPEKDRHYPVDPATLPPGVDPANLVTLVHFVDGVAVGGITYQIVQPEDACKEAPKKAPKAAPNRSKAPRRRARSASKA
jgi:hypothetical protein